MPASLAMIALLSRGALKQAWQGSRQGFLEARIYLVGRAIRIDESHTCRLCFRKLAIVLAHATLEGEALRFHAIMLAPRTRAIERSPWIHVEDERHIRMNATTAELVRAAHEGIIEAAAAGLVGMGRVIEAVTHHDGTTRERRLDHLAHELGTRSLEEQ